MRPTFRTLKIDDVRLLQKLVVEHAESLESDLKILGERVPFGEGTVDLVGLDAEGRLLLVAVGPVADDAVVLRMLDAFAWCVEYPDAVGRLYAVDPAALAVPPRAMFLCERFPDAFLRKVKYLRMPSVDCFEFRYLEVNGVAGLYFNAIDGPQTHAAAASGVAESAPASTRAVEPVAASVEVVEPIARGASIPEPMDPIVTAADIVEPVAAVVEAAEPPLAEAPPADVPSPTSGTVVEHAPIPGPVESAAPPVTRATPPSAAGGPRATEPQQPTELLKGLQIPPNLSSQWRRILKRAVEAPDPAKIRIVREYLQSEFPGCVLYDFYEHERTAQVFQVQNSQGDLMHVAAVSDDFFKKEAERDIRRFLEGKRLARALRDAGSSSVLITPAGLKVAKA